MTEIQRQSDIDAHFLHFTGGIRAARIGSNEWRIDPVLLANKASVSEIFPTDRLERIARDNGVMPLGFQSTSWMNGTHYSIWRPVLPGKENHAQSPSDLWSSITSNLGRARTSRSFDSNENLSESEIVAILDDKSPVEKISQYISLSLRNIDIDITVISDFYYDQLLSGMFSGNVNAERTANTQSQRLFAGVQSFFLHLGAVRDYLGALIAQRIGLPETVDAMNRLVDRISSAYACNDALLDVLIQTGNITPHTDKPARFQISGWMSEMTDVRNRIVHKRPYGSRFVEQTGYVASQGFLHTYTRPIQHEDGSSEDVLTFARRHYIECSILFEKLAHSSGEDTSLLHLSEKDIRSFKLIKR